MIYDLRFLNIAFVISSRARNLIIFAFVVFYFSCNENNELKENNLEEKPTSKNTQKFDDLIDFNSSPIDIKTLVLNDKDFSVTSSMIDSQYLKKPFCSFKDYHLVRGYSVISKKDDKFINELSVYVNDDKYKWNRKDAFEEFKELKVRDSSIKPWHQFYVGMSVDSLRKKIAKQEYHRDKGQYIIYSSAFESSFYYKEDEIDSILIKRNCLLNKSSFYSKKYFKENNLDDYVISNQVSPNFFKEDFNSDGNVDIAFVVRNTLNNKIGVIFFHSMGDYHLIGAGNSESPLESIEYDLFNISEAKIAYKSIIDSISGDILGHDEVNTENISLIMREEEGTSGLLTWNGKEYIYIHTGD